MIYNSKFTILLFALCFLLASCKINSEVTFFPKQDSVYKVDKKSKVIIALQSRYGMGYQWLIIDTNHLKSIGVSYAKEKVIKKEEIVFEVYSFKRLNYKKPIEINFINRATFIEESEDKFKQTIKIILTK
jgi:hypothetical protein